MCFVDYFFVVTMLLGNKSYALGKPDQLGHAFCARVTKTTTLADLQQMLVEEWDAIP